MMDREFGRFLEILDESNIDPTQIDLINKYIYFGLKQQLEIDPQLQNNRFQQFNQPMKMVQQEQQEFNQQNQFESFGGSEKNVPQIFGNQPIQDDDNGFQWEAEQEQEQEQDQEHGSDDEQNSLQQSESETDQQQESEIQEPDLAVNNNGQSLHKRILSRLSKIDKLINKQYRSLISTLLGFIFLTLITAIIKGYFTTQCPNDGNNEAQK